MHTKGLPIDKESNRTEQIQQRNKDEGYSLEDGGSCIGGFCPLFVPHQIAGIEGRYTQIHSHVYQNADPPVSIEIDNSMGLEK